jgi:hypothetical protein
VLQTVACYRTDAWREQMTTAVRQHYTNKDIPEESVFTVQPEGLDPQSRRFSFLVIGDPGEGDASQHVLRDQYLLRDRADEMRFLLLSSDIVYPSGAMSDYERKFYLPFKGMTKPIYALPGNHDWHDELEGFTANFLRRRRPKRHIKGEAKKTVPFRETRMIVCVPTSMPLLDCETSISSRLACNAVCIFRSRPIALPCLPSIRA